MAVRDTSEKAVEERARDVITDLEGGIVGSRTVKDLGDAVQRATRDSDVNRAIGSTRVPGGVFRR